jgi:hypothetical protein
MINSCKEISIIYSKFSGKRAEMPGKGEFGLKNGIDLNDSIVELPAKIFSELRDKLDTNPADKDWRALARAVEKEYRIKYELLKVIVIALSIKLLQF